MSGEVSPTRLPWLLQASAWVCLLLSFLVGLLSTDEVVLLLRLPELRDEASLPGIYALDPEVAQRLLHAQLQALEGMRTPRLLLLGALALCCGLSLMGAARLLWPAGLPREPVRQLLSGTALAAGLLRTLDGAQSTVVARRMSAVVATSLTARTQHVDPLVAATAHLLGPALMVSVPIVQTVIVAGAFVLIGQYLRSERVRQRLAES